MLRFNEHRHAARIQVFFDKVRNLRRQTLLHLRTPRKAIDNTGKFGKPDDLAVARDIRNMTLADERQQMVLTYGVKRNVPHKNELVVLALFVENFEMLLRVGF